MIEDLKDQRKFEYKLELGDDKVTFLQIGDAILRLDLEELEGEFLEKSRQELRESPENVQQGLEELKSLLAGEEDLEIPLDDDAYLLKFLRPNKFYAASAFKMMRNYYKFKFKNPKYCSNLLPTPLRRVFEANILNILPIRTDKGERCLVLHIGKSWDPSKIPVADLFRSLLMVLEIAMIEPRTQVGGVHVILDMKDLSLTHVMQFSPGLAKMVLQFVQECAPIRLKGVHIVNQPYIFNMLYAIFRPFIGEKLRSRLFFHGTNWSALHEKLPQEYVPTYYNGTLNIPEFPGALMADLLCMYDKEFEQCEAIGYAKGRDRSEG